MQLETLFVVNMKTCSSLRNNIKSPGCSFINSHSQKRNKTQLTAQILSFPSLLEDGKTTTKSGSDINPAYIEFGRKFATVEADLLEDVNKNW